MYRTPWGNYMKRILIIDDHPLFREALHNAIKSIMQRVEIHEAETIDDSVQILKNIGRFKLALLDLYMPDTNGFDGLLTLRKQFPKLPVMIVTGQEDSRLVKEAVNYGASGFIAKTASGEEIAHAISEVLAGNIYIPDDFSNENLDEADKEREDLARRLFSLTRQQLIVLRMLREGKLNKQIAYELGVGETTVKAHVSEILRKMNVVSRTQAVIEASKIDFDMILNQATNSSPAD
mgnify:FL=1